MQLLQLLKTKRAYSLCPDDLRRYFLYCHEKLRLSENTLHSRINAIKFYYEQVLGREKFFWEIPRPKKRKQLPKVLSQNELVNLLKGTSNLKQVNHADVSLQWRLKGERGSEIKDEKH